MGNLLSRSRSKGDARYRRHRKDDLKRLEGHPCVNSDNGVRWEDDGGSDSLASTRFHVDISHIKCRGSVFLQRGYDFYFSFTWGGRERKTQEVAPLPSLGQCHWSSDIVTFEYEQIGDSWFSPSVSSMRELAADNLGDLASSERSDSDTLMIKLFGVRNHFLREKEVWVIGYARVSLRAAMSGPLHHVFRLKINKEKRNLPFADEVLRVSYNCRISQFANWRLFISNANLTLFEKPVGGLPAHDGDRSGSGLDLLGGERTPTTCGDLMNGPDVSRFFNLRYRLLKHDRDHGNLYESLQPSHPNVDVLGGKSQVSWDSSVLLPIDEGSSRFLSILLSMLNFEFTETANQFMAAQHPTGLFPPANIESMDTDGNSSSTDVSRAANRNSVFLKKEEKLIGECWIPVEQLFDMIQNSSTDPSVDGHDVNLCRCSETLGENKRKAHNSNISFSQPIVQHGVNVGIFDVVVCFERLPGVMQLGHGVLTEEGVMLISPIVPVTFTKPSVVRRLLGQGYVGISGSPSIRRLRACVQKLERAISVFSTVKTDCKGYEVKQNASIKELTLVCYDLLRIMKTSDKESMVAFVYDSTEELLKVQYMLVGLWELTFQWIDAVSYSVRILIFDIILALLLRGEMNEFMMSTLIKSLPESERQRGPSSEAAKLGLVYYTMCCRTTEWCLQKLSVKCTYLELRYFCARILAIMCFRLPRLGVVIYDAVLPEDETTINEWKSSKKFTVQRENPKRYSVPEWKYGSYSLDPERKLPSKNRQLMEQKSLKLTTSDQKSRKRSSRLDSEDSMLQNGDGLNTEYPPGKVHYDKLTFGNTDHQAVFENWESFRASLVRLFGKEVVKEQENLFEKYSDHLHISSGAWLRRIMKHGHFFFLLAREWIVYILNTIGSLATVNSDRVSGMAFNSGIQWHKIFGFRHFLKAFLLELRNRELKELPESMRALAMMFLVDNSLITPFFAIVIPKTSFYDVESVTICIDLLSSWITAIHGWPGRFIATQVLNSKGPLTAAEADQVLREEHSGFFYSMEKKKIEDDKGEVELMDKAVGVPDLNDEQSQASKAPLNQLPSPTLAEMRASGTLTSPNSFVLSDEASSSSYFLKSTGISGLERFVSAWDFDFVSIYFPYLDVIRRAVKKHGPTGILKNNSESKCNWFCHIYAEKPPLLPFVSDFGLLRFSLWQLLRSDHFQIKLKALQFIYSHWDSFPMQLREIIRALMLASADEDSGSREKEQFGMLVEWGCNSKEEKEARWKIVGDERLPLFLTLFFHWAEEVRFFFHSTLAFRLCRGRKQSKYLGKLTAYVRIVLASLDESLVNRIWFGTQINSKHVSGIDSGVFSKDVNNVIVSKSLHHRFAVSSEEGISIVSGIPAQFFDASGTYSSKNVKKFVSSAKESLVNVRNVEKDSEKRAVQLEEDFELICRSSLPSHLLPYAPESVLYFQRIWKVSLCASTKAPVLEWNVVVLDKGEMRPLGGLAVLSHNTNRKSSDE